jgi:hypothetical protein
MTLTYRGISYPASIAIATPATETTATYRGQRYTLRQPLEVAKKSQAQMTYRGVSYTDRYQAIEDLIAPLYA